MAFCDEVRGDWIVVVFIIRFSRCSSIHDLPNLVTRFFYLRQARYSLEIRTLRGAASHSEGNVVVITDCEIN